jgi:hypothetical protein
MARLLVGFWCEDTYHVGSLDLSSDQDRTCSWNLGRGVPLASLLVELVASRDMGTATDPSPHPGMH